MLAWVLDALTTRQSQDRIDVQSLVGKDACSPFDLTGFQLASQYHEDIAVLTLMSHPVFILFIRDG